MSTNECIDDLASQGKRDNHYDENQDNNQNNEDNDEDNCDNNNCNKNSNAIVCFLQRTVARAEARQ